MNWSCKKKTISSFCISPISPPSNQHSFVTFITHELFPCSLIQWCCEEGLCMLLWIFKHGALMWTNATAEWLPVLLCVHRDWLLWPRFSMVFLSPSKQMPREHLQLHYDCTLTRSFPLIIHYLPIILCLFFGLLEMLFSTPRINKWTNSTSTAAMSHYNEA